MERKLLSPLPDHVIPITYRVWLSPDLSTFTFDGEMDMDIVVRRPTKEIVLHAADLKGFKNIAITASHLERDIPGKAVLDAESQTVRILFKKQLPFGFCALHMDYAGEINDHLCGLYRSSYTNEKGEKEFVAVSQCEATDARRIFPCFDEPRHKAIFHLAADVPKGLTAISNMHVSVTTPRTSTGARTVVFAPTPPMSSYLFAFIVGRFREGQWCKGRTKDGVRVRIITVPGKEHLGAHALDRAIRVLEFYTDYYQYPYPLPKCDLAAIPDFGAGAMENLGLDTFREEALLVDPKNTSLAQIERVDLVIDHELGHQWHGDVVTMRDWGGLWLNEAFATWTQLLIARNLDPEKGAEEKFVAEDFVAGKAADGLRSTRAVHINVKYEDEIAEQFDMITYEKGGSLIRMLEAFVTPEKFRDAMRIYIPRHEYGNVGQEHLWGAVGEVSGTNVVRMMDAWTNRAGLPVVSVERLTNDGRTSSYRLSQRRFLYERDDALEAETVWTIPMRIRTSSEPEQTTPFILSERGPVDPGIEPRRMAGDPWTVWNAGASGFYRVHYGWDDLMGAGLAMMSGRIADVCERIALVDDAAALTKAGYYDTRTMFEFFDHLRNERNPRVLGVAVAALQKVSALFAKEPYAPDINAFACTVLDDAISWVGWNEDESEEYQKKILRGVLIGAAGYAGHEPTVAEARRRFAAACTDLNTLNPNIRGAVYRTVAVNGGADEYEALLGLYGRVADSQEEQRRVFVALASFRMPELLQRTLNMLLSDSVRSQDVYINLRPLGMNPAATRMTWEFTKEHWSDFERMYKKAGFLSRMIPAVCNNLSSMEDEADVRAFFEAHQVEGATRTIAQALESIRINASWLARDREKLGRYFS